MGSIEIIEGDEMMSNSRVEVKEAGGELSEKERQAFRESLNRDIEAFLSGGGQVQ